jgi:5'-3' exonuclease
MDGLIVTGDRDVLQLVSDRVTVLMTRRGITEMTRFTPDTVREKYGLSPSQYPDFAAVRGDPSDNLPGIPGVGEKTATKWIAEFGSLANLVDRVDEVKGKAGDALRANLGNVLRNRQLTELVTDLPAQTVGAARTTCCRCPGTGRRSTSSSTRSSSACSATGSTRRCRTASAAPRRRLRRSARQNPAWRSRPRCSDRVRSRSGWKIIFLPNGRGWQSPEHGAVAPAI